MCGHARQIIEPEGGEHDHRQFERTGGVTEELHPRHAWQHADEVAEQRRLAIHAGEHEQRPADQDKSEPPTTRREGTQPGKQQQRR